MGISIFTPFLPESIADRAIARFKRLVKRYKKDSTRAIREAAEKFKKKGVTFLLLQREMTRRHSISAMEKRAAEEMAGENKKRKEFQEAWEKNEIISGHAHRDEFGEFVDDIRER